MSFVNIAKTAKVTFSSTSPWSTDDDCREIVTAEHNRDYSFHTNLEHNPWVKLDLGDVYVLHSIVVFNIKIKNYQIRTNTLQVAISSDNVNYEIIHKGFIPFKEKIEFNLDSLKKARYVKLSLDGLTYFHLSKIEIFIDESKNSGLIFDNPSIPDKIKFHAFYIGSCRYMGLFPKHFPARLHTTKEIINFLNNYNKIDPNMVDVNYIYGDLLHPICKEKSIAYCNNMDRIFNSVTTVFLEITSRKYILNNGVVYNNYYYNFYNEENDKEMRIIDDNELFSDLLHIKYLLKNLFGIESIVVIPHIDLLLDNGEKIVARNKLKSSLERICDFLKIEFLDINNAFPEGSYFKDIAPDSKHYSEKGNSIVWPYINDYLNNFVSDRCNVLKYMLRDAGVTSDNNPTALTSWSYAPITKKITSEYTKLTKPTTNNSYCHTPQLILFNVIIEFDIYQSGGEGNPVVQLRSSEATVLGHFILSDYGLELDTWHHIKIRISGSKVYINNNPTSTWILSSPVTSVYLTCQSTTDEVRYKNFVIYQI